MSTASSNVINEIRSLGSGPLDPGSLDRLFERACHLELKKGFSIIKGSLSDGRTKCSSSNIKRLHDALSSKGLLGHYQDFRLCWVKHEAGRLLQECMEAYNAASGIGSDFLTYINKDGLDALCKLWSLVPELGKRLGKLEELKGSSEFGGTLEYVECGILSAIQNARNADQKYQVDIHHFKYFVGQWTATGSISSENFSNLRRLYPYFPDLKQAELTKFADVLLSKWSQNIEHHKPISEKDFDSLCKLYSLVPEFRKRLSTKLDDLDKKGKFRGDRDKIVYDMYSAIKRHPYKIKPFERDSYIQRCYDLFNSVEVEKLKVPSFSNDLLKNIRQHKFYRLGESEDLINQFCGFRGLKDLENLIIRAGDCQPDPEWGKYCSDIAEWYSTMKSNREYAERLLFKVKALSNEPTLENLRKTEKALGCIHMRRKRYFEKNVFSSNQKTTGAFLKKLSKDVSRLIPGSGAIEELEKITGRRHGLGNQNFSPQRKSKLIADGKKLISKNHNHDQLIETMSTLETCMNFFRGDNEKHVPLKKQFLDINKYLSDYREIMKADASEQKSVAPSFPESLKSYSLDKDSAKNMQHILSGISKALEILIIQFDQMDLEVVQKLERDGKLKKDYIYSHLLYGIT